MSISKRSGRGVHGKWKGSLHRYSHLYTPGEFKVGSGRMVIRRYVPQSLRENMVKAPVCNVLAGMVFADFSRPSVLSQFSLSGACKLPSSTFRDFTTEKKLDSVAFPFSRSFISASSFSSHPSWILFFLSSFSNPHPLLLRRECEWECTKSCDVLSSRAF